MVCEPEHCPVVVHMSTFIFEEVLAVFVVPFLSKKTEPFHSRLLYFPLCV